jgi:DNA polymerase III gamma/tau subunit
MGKYKTFLIENAQNLNNEASNAFLKLLEEPPKGSIFIFLVSDLSKLYPTILSRAQKIVLSKLRDLQIEDWIKQKYDYDHETIKKIVQFSQGLLGKAFLVSENISLLEEYKESYNRFYEFCNSALSNRLNISQKLSTRFRTDRNGIYQELNNWMNFCDLIIKKNFEKDLNFIFDFDLKKTYSIMEINKIIITLLRSINNLKINVNSRLVFDVMSLDIPEKQNSVR